MHNFRFAHRTRSIIIGILLAIVVGAIESIHGFLAVTDPCREGIMVFEAWIPDAALPEVIGIFRAGHYKYLAIVGGPQDGSGAD
jgi:hypothetical protein